VDNAELAFSEILEQLQPEKNLLKNSVGIIHCPPDFIDSGVVALLSQNLPFRIVGMTTIGSVTTDTVGEMMLSLMVLTDDKISFAIGLTEPILSPDVEIIRTAYESTVKTLSAPPSLMLAFFPSSVIKIGVGGDFVPENFPKIVGNLPIFGSLSISSSVDLQMSYVFCDGENYSDRFAFILIQGDISPRFYRGTISEQKILKDRGIITKSQDSYIFTINDVPVFDYLKNTLGLNIDVDDPALIHMIPLILDINDGTLPIVRLIMGFTPEGVAFCSGQIHEGTSLSLGRFDKDTVLETTSCTIKTILEQESQLNGILIYSCAARYWALGFDTQVEMEAVRDTLLESKIPYVMNYSGGELCPVFDKDGKTFTNQLHNYSFVACVF
jgi:hypothetical protein